MCVLRKLILTFTCKHKGLRTAKRLTKTKVGGGIYKSNIQTCYKATVIKIMWQQPKNKGSNGMEHRVKKQVPVYIDIWRTTEVVIQISDRKKFSFSTSGAGTNGYPLREKKMKLEPYLTALKKTQLKWSKDLNVRFKYMVYCWTKLSVLIYIFVIVYMCKRNSGKKEK